MKLMNMTRNFLLGIVLTLPLSGFADDVRAARQFSTPVVTIGGNNGPIDLGDMVILSADYDQNHLPEGLVDMKFNWTVLDDGKQKKVFTADGGKEIAFAVGMHPRHITVMLDVNYLFETQETVKVVGADGKSTDRTFITSAATISPAPIFSDVIVGTSLTPNPPTPPLPPPQPVPVPPNGTFGLAPFVYNTFVANAALDHDSKVKLAMSLANSLNGIASKIASVRTYSDVATILADTKTGNDAAFASLNIDMSKTIDIQTAIRKKIFDLYNTQKINTASDIATAWKELALGLSYVK